MGKKKKNRKKKQTIVSNKPNEFILKLSNRYLVLLWIGITLFFWSLSFLSPGFYQGEEGVQYMNMKEFWHNPHVILGNWAKPGWKLIYILPSLLGFKFLYFFTSMLSALSVVLSYKYLEVKKYKQPFVVVVILLSQFFLLQMAFRNFSEVLAAVVLLSSILFYEKAKYLYSALFMSYLVIIRQEWLPFAGLYGLFLLYKRLYIPAFALALFPLLINIWGWIASGDPIYFYSNAVATTESYGDRYPRQGFDHYFKVSLPILGPLCIIGIVAYYTSLVNKKYKPYYSLIIPTVGCYILFSLLNLKEPTIGASTGGNWRYLIVIMPLLAILSAIGWINMTKDNKKLKYIITLGFISLILLLKSTFGHNYIGLNDERDMSLVIGVFLALALAVVPLSLKWRVIGMIIIAIVLNILTFQPIKMVGEDKVIKEEVIPFLETQKIDNEYIVHRNMMINFFWNKTKYDYKNGFELLTKKSIDEAPVGSYILWDSHYSKRDGKVDYTYLHENKESFRFVKQIVSDDKRFMLLIYKKIS